MITFVTKLRQMSIREWVHNSEIDGRPSFTFEILAQSDPVVLF